MKNAYNKIAQLNKKIILIETNIETLSCIIQIYKLISYINDSGFIL